MADPVEEGFLAQIRSFPQREDTRGVYADWLEEQGRKDESEFLRLQTLLPSLAPEDPRFGDATAALGKLAKRLPLHWRSVVARAPIEACTEIRFDFVCPKKWDALDRSDAGDDVRHCSACKKDVYYSRTVEEAQQHARRGRCVVVDLVPLRRRGDLDPPRMDRDFAPVTMGVALPGPKLPPPQLPGPEPSMGVALPGPAPSIWERVKGALKIT